jgi:hypothetical protein
MENRNAFNKETPRHTRPVLKPPVSRYGNNRWFVYSPSLKRQMVLGSDLEHDEWVRTEATKKKFFCEQPRRVEVRLPTGIVRTVFDLWIHWDDGTEEYREVKYSHELGDGARAIRQVEAQRTWCELHGFKHEVVTEKIIRANPLYLENWKLILRHLAMTSRIDIGPITKVVTRFLLKVGRATVAMIERACASWDQVLVRSAIFSLLHNHFAKASLDSQPFSRSLYVEVNQ